MKMIERWKFYFDLLRHHYDDTTDPEIIESQEKLADIDGRLRRLEASLPRRR